jgi:serine/threonine-protein kinase RsbW
VTARLPLEESALDLYEHAPCGYLSTDPDWLILRVNQTFLDWTGYTREELVGVKRFPDLLTVGGRIYHETHCGPLLRMQDAVREIAGDVVCADGRRLPTLFNSVLKRDAGGEPLLVRTTIFDASDRRRYERELLAARDRERAAREQTERLQRLSRALVSAADMRTVARAVGEALVATFGASRTGVAVSDDEGALRPLFGHGSDGPIPSAEGEPAFEEDTGGAIARLPVGAEPAAGVLWVAFDEPRTFTPEERALLVAFAGQTTLALERSRLYEEQRDVAHVLQQSMLGRAPRPDPRYDVATHYEPASKHLEVGGDWYDTFGVPSGRVAIVIGDVVGRGLIAASAMGQLRSAVRALAGTGRGPADVLSGLDTFTGQVPAAQYATLAYAEIDLDAGEMHFACAGHLPPLLAEPGGSLRLLMDGRSPPLGILAPGSPRGQAVVPLPQGALLLLYTDGLVERRGEPIDDGLDRLVATVAQQRDVPPRTLVASLAASLLPPVSDDDVCLLGFVRR